MYCGEDSENLDLICLACRRAHELITGSLGIRFPVGTSMATSTWLRRAVVDLFGSSLTTRLRFEIAGHLRRAVTFGER